MSTQLTAESGISPRGFFVYKTEFFTMKTYKVKSILLTQVLKNLRCVSVTLKVYDFHFLMIFLGENFCRGPLITTSMSPD